MKMSQLLLVGLTLFSSHAFAKGLSVKLSDVSGKTSLVNTITAQVSGETLKILTDDKGRSVYTFERDKANTSTCKGGCLTEWPPVHVPANSRVELPFAQIKGNDGQPQLTLNGMPLYYYNDDKKPGDTFGQYPQWDVITVVDQLNFFSEKISVRNDLSGHVLSCVYSSDLGFGVVHTQYFFFMSPKDNTPVVARFSDTSGRDIQNYHLNGTLLVIDDPNDNSLTYDLSHSQVERNFDECVFPGQGGGDAKEVCSKAKENCSLN